MGLLYSKNLKTCGTSTGWNSSSHVDQCALNVIVCLPFLPLKILIFWWLMVSIM